MNIQYPTRNNELWNNGMFSRGDARPTDSFGQAYGINKSQKPSPNWVIRN